MTWLILIAMVAIGLVGYIVTGVLSWSDDLDDFAHAACMFLCYPFALMALGGFGGMLWEAFDVGVTFG